MCKSKRFFLKVPDERLQEEVCVWVKLMPDSKLTETELRDYCKNNISHFKVPRYIKFVDSFPINANNKILKNVMRQKATEELKL
jgi:fatty-acyl-CoA synthase